MSKCHGDKARFHRLRKQAIARRLRARELRIELAKAPIADPPPHPPIEGKLL